MLMALWLFYVVVGGGVSWVGVFLVRGFKFFI